MTAQSPGVHVGIIEGRLAAAGLAACLVQTSIDSGARLGSLVADSAGSERSPSASSSRSAYHIPAMPVHNLLLPYAYRVGTQVYDCIAATTVGNSGQHQRACALLTI